MVKRQDLSDNDQEASQLNQKYQSDSQYESQSSRQQQHIQKIQDESSEQEQNSNQIQEKFNKLQKQQQKIKQQLKQLPYGLILKQKQQLEKQRNSILKKKINKKHKNIKKPNQNDQHKDKHGPKQIPIHKKHPKKVATIFQPKRPKTIDPRFQDYAGYYNQDLAMKSFDFIPKIQQQQIKALRTTLQKSKKGSNKRSRKKLLPEQKVRLQQQYNKLTNQKRQVELVEIEKQVKRNIRQRDYANNNKEYQQRDRYGGQHRGGDRYGGQQRDRYGRQDNRYPHHHQQQNSRPAYIDKKEFRQEFQKVKLSKMSEQNRKQYLKNKQKKIFKNQQVERNNLMYQTSNAYRKHNK